MVVLPYQGGKCNDRGPSGREAYGAGMRQLTCWECGFKYHRLHGCFLLWECCVSSSGGLCNELITRPEESHRPWCVVVCDLETRGMKRPWPTGGCYAKIYI